MFYCRRQPCTDKYPCEVREKLKICMNHTQPYKRRTYTHNAKALSHTYAFINTLIARTHAASSSEKREKKTHNSRKFIYWKSVLCMNKFSSSSLVPRIFSVTTIIKILHNCYLSFCGGNSQYNSFSWFVGSNQDTENKNEIVVVIHSGCLSNSV